MDFIEAEDTFVPVEEFGIQDTDQTSDNFQKFMYELFTKNGIINDLRAYLRGHIVNVLKTAETGDLPVCQKHFTQRLELPLQALNILIVEYLLTMEFNYTLSVFISEIPLANMVFEFTKTIHNLDTEAKMSNMQLEEGDVWSILNYIGFKCSSEHALKILEIYKSEKQPLLMCILKWVSMNQKEQEHISDQSTITQSSEALDDRSQDSHRHISNCKHFMYCKTCQNRVARLKKKYRKKKAMMEQKKILSVKKVNVETFMNNVNDLEQTLIDEMFQQLKAVYEAEVEMVKKEQQKKLKQSIASHAFQLQKHREKMEQSFKAREEELSNAIHQKKRFLWGLARSLRDQHALLASAMSDVRRQTERLTHKECSLKTQLEKAEQKLKNRGEDMRNQISNELVMMEGHLESMKKERDRINEERKEIENLKNNDANTPTEKVLGPQYDFIKTELSILRKYIEATKFEPKCPIEGGTGTDFGIKCFMNNENIGIKKEKLESNRVINDLKKQNNINFSQSNLDNINDITSGRPSTVSSVGDTGGVREDTGDIRNGDIIDGVILDVDKVCMQDRHLRVGEVQDGAPGDTRGRENDVGTLRQENDRLKTFARQQHGYIQTLCNEKERLQRALSEHERPRTAASGTRLAALARAALLGLPDASYHRGSVGGRARGFAPVGGASGPETCGRWRRASGTTLPPHATKEIGSNLTVDETHIRRPPEEQQPTSNITQGLHQQTVSGAGTVREKSPKLGLKEVKEKLRSKVLKESSPKASDNSSDAMLWEAKRRLRKLEIEAEAVEKSYQDFRKRQRELREERENMDHVRDNIIENVVNVDKKHKLFENYENITTYEKVLPLPFPKESPETIKKDFDKYFKEYSANMDSNRWRFENKNAVFKNVKPIPEALGDKREVDYLETPLMEFRKLYQGQRTTKNKSNTIVKDVHTDKDNSVSIVKSEKGPNFINNNQNRLQLQENIDKTTQKPKLTVLTNNEPTDTLINNDIDDNNYLNNNEIAHKIDNNKNNLLVVEVENGCDNVVSEENQGVLIVVESSVDNRDLSDDNGEQMFTPMTIIVSPKNKGGSKDFESPVEIRSRSESPQLSPRSTLGPIFHIDNKEISSEDVHLELSKEHVESISEVEKNQDDYLDDFSADVDNYNSPSEDGNNSPISLPKTTEDESFWES